MGMGRNKRWSDMSRGRQMVTIVVAVIQVGLQAWALWDIARRPDAEINGSRKAWVAASFVNFAGPIAYFRFGRKRAEDGEQPESAEA